jgi:hypothetical protein
MTWKIANNNSWYLKLPDCNCGDALAGESHAVMAKTITGLIILTIYPYCAFEKACDLYVEYHYERLVDAKKAAESVFA